MPILLTKSETLLPEQKKVLLVKYAAKPFAQLTETEQRAHSLALLLKINVVTGWPVPESDAEQNILAEQLKLYLIENWAEYNIDEIMYAMRSYATSINNWGKNMNLSLIGDALNQYQKERSDVSKYEESQASKPKQNLLPMAADFSELTEMYYQDYLKGRFHLYVMPAGNYDACVKAGYIEVDVYEDYLSIAKQMLITKLCADRNDASGKEQNEISDKIEMIKRDNLPDLVVEFAKKLTVEFLYKKAVEAGYKNLFVKH